MGAQAQPPPTYTTPSASPNRGVLFRPPEQPEPVQAQAMVPVPENQQAAAPYAFNPVTGMLKSPGNGAGGGGGGVESRTRFVEGGPRGGFRRVPEVSGNTETSVFNVRRAAVAAAQAAGNQNTMRNAVLAAQSVVAACGLFCQGLLSGVCGLNLFMTYFLDAGNLASLTSDSGFLHYYSPIAVTCQRVYVTLAAISLLAAVDKYSRDSLSGFMLQGFALQKVDALAVLSFFMCFVMSIAAVPFEDQLYYANERVPGWWLVTSASSTFVSSLKNWHGVNATRVVFGLVGYACVCVTTTPAMLDVVQRAEDLARVPIVQWGSAGRGGEMTREASEGKFGGNASSSRTRKSSFQTTARQPGGNDTEAFAMAASLRR